MGYGSAVAVVGANNEVVAGKEASVMAGSEGGGGGGGKDMEMEWGACCRQMGATQTA
jgi:hypothetical protein